MKLLIGVTDCSKYDNYSNWILKAGKDIEVVKLSEKTNNFDDVKNCHGVLLTGGEDVHPRFYNKPEYFSLCHKDDVNEKRDEFELRLMEYTEKNNVPVLGICRGLQIFNVFAGGSLIPDIPTWGKFSHSKTKEGKDRYHSTKVAAGSWLADIIGRTEEEINSNHHQAADKIGQGLIVSALSEDGVVEAIERKDPEGKGYLCLVQWHPERMDNQGSPFVENIRKSFVESIEVRL